MKKCIFILFLGLVLLVPDASSAANKPQHDMSTVTCKEIFEDAESVTFMLFWIDGYLSHKKNNTMFSEESMQEMGRVLAEECKNNDNKKLGAILKSW